MKITFLASLNRRTKKIIIPTLLKNEVVIDSKRKELERNIIRRNDMRALPIGKEVG